jgi:hypothetical protein
MTCMTKQLHNDDNGSCIRITIHITPFNAIYYLIIVSNNSQ